VIGREKVYTCKEFLLAIPKMYYLDIERMIVQFYIKSVAGSYMKPIGYFVIPYGKSSTWI
jgi:hypothetical protein